MRSFIGIAFLLSVVAVASNVRAAQCSKDWISFQSRAFSKEDSDRAGKYIYIRRSDILMATWDKPKGFQSGEVMVRWHGGETPIKYFYATRQEFVQIAICLHKPDAPGGGAG